MTRRNSLLEWADQTRKLSKALDYMVLDLIDSISKISGLIGRKVLRKNKAFFDQYCLPYHKVSPLDILKQEPKEKANEQIPEYAQEGIDRIKRVLDFADIQWCEIIDFIYERPELINPSIADDEYLQSQVERVCKLYKKKNPFKNGVLKRLGKQWKDEDGKWRTERRKRF